MPYIKDADRQKILQHGALLQICEKVETETDLGFIAARLTRSFIQKVLTLDVNVHENVRAVEGKIIERTSYRCVFYLNSDVENLCALLGVTVGEYNYCITVILHWYLRTKGVSYARINRIIGVLDRVKFEVESGIATMRGFPDQLAVFDDAVGILGCVMLELYRMIASPYENLKVIENGAVSVLDAAHELDLKTTGHLCQIWRTTNELKK